MSLLGEQHELIVSSDDVLVTLAVPVVVCNMFNGVAITGWPLCMLT